LSAGVSFDGDWVIMKIHDGTAPANKLWVAKLDSSKAFPSNGNLFYVGAKAKENSNGSKFRMSLSAHSVISRIEGIYFILRPHKMRQSKKSYDMTLTSL
jgi:hypothetical protein